MLKAVNLTKSYGRRKVLLGLSIELTPGEVVTLVGANGAGKTTLIRVLADLTRPEMGVIHFGNYTAREQPAEYRANLGVVLHAPMLYGNLTARENLRFFSRLYQVADREERISRVLETVSLQQRAGELVRVYSRGMQQRLALARALLHDPALLLLDEPYTGLDEESSMVLDRLIQAASENGKMVLLSTHDLERACVVGTRVDLLHGGRIALSRPVKNLTPGSLSSMHREAIGGPVENDGDRGGT